ncbi:MAG TPA: hypothetical protein EYO31_01145 [Phycisphaerales bacterium]|nr:hypothetical protein [Phycisphaerales bacterium]HIO53235.1 hypothetical protein [Phycisphaerales bacterium]
MKLIVQNIILASLTTSAMSDFVGLSLEFQQVDENLFTMRLYADFTASTDQLNAVFGDSQSSLYIRSDNGFYQNPFGGPTSVSINTALFGIFPSLAYDSWVTIGSEDQVDNQMLDIGIDWIGFESGGDIETNNGTWFATPDDMQVVAGSDLRVLIGQFTTYGSDSEIYGSINLQGKQGDFENFVARDQYFGWVPAPATIVLIGFAGLKRRRRH